MTESVQIEYFKKSETFAPSMVIVLEPPKATEETADITEKEIRPSSFDALINQDIIKVGDYRKIKATRKVIGHVHFEPD
ncbi:MAG: hypothetical protein ABR985_02455 [Methanotrichaceae archaeon]|jgi:hypothetical protein